MDASNQATVSTVPMSSDSELLRTNKKPNAKHVSRACLECRHRHLKCDGQMPKCGRCTLIEKDCSYVKSNRGGSRQKGVKKTKNNPTDDDHLHGFKLPCVSGGGEARPCPNGHDKNSCGFLKDGNLHALPCSNKRQDAKSNIGYEKLKRPRSTGGDKYLDQMFKRSSVIHNYYTHFHNAHPVLPPLGEIDQFLMLSDYPKEILAVMKLLGDGYTSSKYCKNINEVFEIAAEVVEYIDTHEKDVVTVQTLILLSLVCHISALHDISTSLRHQAIDLAIHLDINNLDSGIFTGEDINGNMSPLKDNLSPSSPDDVEMNINFHNTKRVRKLPDSMLKESARRCFWELFFLDIIIGSADGKSLSKLTSTKCFVNFPSVPTKFQFDYETRSYTSKLVDDSVRLNNVIFSEMSIGHQYTKLTASLSNWELKFSNPDFYKLPYLIDGNGAVNEGIQQGLIMLNYAKIFTHRPLSFLWRSDIPRNLKSVEKLTDELMKTEHNFQEVPNEKDLINSRKIIETRKTIDAANLIAKTLIDTNPIDILHRTPLNACSLAFAGLVHLSAYLWSTQVVQSTDKQTQINTHDLNIYEEYMKLELSGIYQISSHWYLSSKIANYLLDSISRLLPDLHQKLRTHFQHHIDSNKKLEKESKKKLHEQQEQLLMKQQELARKSELSQVISEPTGFLQTGMSYNLPITSNAADLPPMPTTPQSQGLFSNKEGSVSSVSTNPSSEQLPQQTSYPLQPISISSLMEKDEQSPLDRVLATVNALSRPSEGLMMDSPDSETGCDWIDNNQLDFDFKNYDFGDFDIDSLTAIDDMIKSASRF